MIIKNEAEMLPEALDSLMGVDKITICDTGSSDDTFGIYEDYKKKMPLKWFKYSKFNTELYSFKSFSDARNECKEHCTGDWLIYIDGDEVCQFDIQKIKNMINSQWIKQYNVLEIEVQTDVELSRQYRAHRNKSDLWYFRNVHNNLGHFPNGRDGNIERLSLDEVYGTSLRIRARTSPNHEREPDRTLKLLESQLEGNPYSNRDLYYITREWLNRQEPIKALYYLERYFKVAQPTNETADAYFLAATCHITIGDTVSAITCALKAVAILPSFKVAWKLLESMYPEEWKPYWAHMIKKADNKGVLFIRDRK